MNYAILLTHWKDSLYCNVYQLSPLDRQFLVERQMMSRELADADGPRAVLIDRREQFSVMINEEDHLRMQALRPGLQIKACWQAIDAVDTALEAKLDFAFSPELGYLTACPTNLGTGIRVSAMLHLPGLVLAEEITRIVNETINAPKDIVEKAKAALGEPLGKLITEAPAEALTLACRAHGNHDFMDARAKRDDVTVIHIKRLR